MGEQAKQLCFHLTHDLRQNGIPTQMDLSGKKVGKLLQYADQIGTTYVTVIGDDELQTQQIELKEMATGIKYQLPLKELISILKIQLKGQAYLELWKELSSPFESEEQTNFFVEKLHQSLEETKKLTNQVLHNVEKMKKRMDESI
jgi:histidyl-tRNA synthetase